MGEVLPEASELERERGGLPVRALGSPAVLEDEENGITIAPSLTQHRPRAKKSVAYTKEAGEIVAGMIAQGMTPLSIERLPGMPTAFDLRRWESTHKEFASLLSLARKAYADYLADSALEIADQSEYRSFQSDKIKVDLALKLAAAHDPERYGNKTKITGDPNAPLTFLIDTGIRRGEGDGKPIEVKLDTSDPAKISEKEPNG